MTAALFHNQVGDRVAAMRSEHTRREIAELLDAERKRISDLDTDIERRAFRAFPANKNLQKLARSAMQDAAQIALTGSYEK